MADDEPLIDCYEVLQVSPDCDTKTLEAAYRRLAKMYHPDNSGTSDPIKFNEVLAAYRAIRSSRRRQAESDRLYDQHNGEHADFSGPGEGEVYGTAALRDAEDHAKILVFLYKRRRDDAQNPGVVAFHLQELLGCSYEQLEFHKWYLKEKGLITATEQGTLAITIHGVDHVISMSRSTRTEKLLLNQGGFRRETEGQQ